MYIFFFLHIQSKSIVSLYFTKQAVAQIDAHIHTSIYTHTHIRRKVLLTLNRVLIMKFFFIYSILCALFVILYRYNGAITMTTIHVKSTFKHANLMNVYGSDL